MALSLQRGNILWSWIQSVLYGMYTIIFMCCVYALYSRRLFDSVRKNPLVLVVVSLFLCGTAEAIIYFIYTFELADVPSDLPFPGETEAQLREKDTGNLLAVILAPIVATNTVIADGLLIWRTYVVWAECAIIAAIPSIILLIGAGCGYALTYYSAQAYFIRLHLPLSTKVVPESWIQAGIWSERMRTIFFSMSLATNVIVTILIAGRISWLNRGLKDVLGDSNSKPYQRIILLVIIESGVFNAACLLLGLIMNGPLKAHLLQGASDAGFQVATFVVFPSTIANIFPTLLVLLVALGKTTEPSSVTSSSAVPNRTHLALSTIVFAHSEPLTTTTDGDSESGLHLRTMVSRRDAGDNVLEKKDGSSSIRGASRVEDISVQE
ncbi:hypothetical protein OE88DRAFT_1653394 [Heliocybe sulcata]|uniref:Uncharacterized protein n=1 Tax=Heliocybe sulcata TaxID=5364 RepID=A0A5C3NC33_9AGAM|nr:hypothetical protein OE88DRAFT_1653394 [Heliocybe sulcata]